MHNHKPRHTPQILILPVIQPKIGTIYHYPGIGLNSLGQFKSFLVNPEVILHSTKLD